MSTVIIGGGGGKAAVKADFYVLLAESHEDVAAFGPFDTEEAAREYAQGKGNVWRLIPVTNP